MKNGLFDADVHTFRLFKDGINNILSGIALTANDFIYLYDACFKLACADKSQNIYDFVQEAVDNHCKLIKCDIDTVYNPHLLDVFNESNLIGKDIKNLIAKQFFNLRKNYIQQKLVIYMVHIQNINRITSYLSRGWIQLSRNRPLREVMIDIWKKNIGEGDFTVFKL
jgi:hypothetical protein